MACIHVAMHVSNSNFNFEFRLHRIWLWVDPPLRIRYWFGKILKLVKYIVITVRKRMVPSGVFITRLYMGNLATDLTGGSR